MRASVILVVLLNGLLVSASWFSSGRVYDSWHETRLERWLDQHNIPFPHPSDRQSLIDAVSQNFDKVKPAYSDWDTKKARAWLEYYGIVAPKTDSDVQAVKEQVRANWESVESRLDDSKNWIFDTWSDSQLKAFLDKHGFSYQEGRENLLGAAYGGYDTLSSSYYKSQDWIFDSWTESELKAWLDRHGVDTYQGTERNELISALRRNAYKGKLQLLDGLYESKALVKEKTDEAQSKLYDTWSDSALKSYLDERDVYVPQGSNRDELVALVRRNRYKATGAASAASKSASEAYGAATSSAGNAWAGATDSASSWLNDVNDDLVSGWSNSALKRFLDERGIPAPQSGKKDDLVAAVRKNKHAAQKNMQNSQDQVAQYFEGWSAKDLQAWANEQKIKLSSRAQNNREELVKSVQNNYRDVAKSSESRAKDLEKKARGVKQWAIEEWSDSEIHEYLKRFSDNVPSNRGEAIRKAKANAKYWADGGRWQAGDYIQWASQKVFHLGDSVGDLVKGYSKKGQQGGHSMRNRLKQEL